MSFLWLFNFSFSKRHLWSVSKWINSKQICFEKLSKKITFIISIIRASKWLHRVRRMKISLLIYKNSFRYITFFLFIVSLRNKLYRYSSSCDQTLLFSWLPLFGVDGTPRLQLFFYYWHVTPDYFKVVAIIARVDEKRFATILEPELLQTENRLLPFNYLNRRKERKTCFRVSST